MTRPTKLTPALQERIVEALALGTTYEHAAAFGGIDYATFRRWTLAGERQPAGPYGAFQRAVSAAEARAVVSSLALIEKAARDGDWRAAAWKLERRHPHDYGRRVHELSGPNAGPLEVRTHDYSDLLGPLAPRPVDD